MFAGPNGSGKSTLKQYLSEKLLGVYINPDDIEKDIRVRGFLDLSMYGIAASDSSVLPVFTGSEFLKSVQLGEAAQRLTYQNGRLNFSQVEVNSYFASVAADLIRQTLLQAGTSFTLETVMSHPGKVELLADAQRRGFRTYLYFIATDDPAINISRVRNRVQLGGHSVPDDRIQSRYFKSLELLMDAIRHTNRAYIFDNSGHNLEHTWLAEITDGKVMELKVSKAPAWFRRAVLDKVKACEHQG
jgi:predicted ABC-type ATPase